MAKRVYTCRDHRDRATSGQIADTKEKLQEILARAYEGAGDKPNVAKRKAKQVKIVQCSVCGTYFEKPRD